MKAKVYVITSAKYDEGNLEGTWLNLDDYSDEEEFLKACKNLYTDEKDPEFMYLYFEFDRDLCSIMDPLVSGTSISPVVWDLLQVEPEELVYVEATWSEYTSKISVEEALELGVEACCGEYSDLEDFAYSFYIELTEARDLDYLSKYIDWSRVAQDLETEGFVWFQGYVFNFS